MEQDSEIDTLQSRKKVQRHSPDRLLRQPVRLEGDVTVSAERHRGRLVVRLESLESPEIEQ